MSKINVLVFPDGEINSAEVHDALATCVNINLYGASSIERHGKFLFKNHIPGLPNIYEPNFYQELNKIVNLYDIDIVIPTHDTVSLELIRNQDKLDCKILGGDLYTAEVCRSKAKSYALYKDCSFTPEIYEKDKVKKFPIFAKPDKGQGAKGAKIINTEQELKSTDLEDYVICEYLPGIEYTVDCLTDKNGELCVISPRSRARTLAGVSVHGKNEVLTDEIKTIAEKINKRLHFCGLWYFQIKKDSNDKFKLLEISNRCAGTMCLTRAKGLNLPLLSVYANMGHDIKPIPNPYNVTIDRSLINRYEIDYHYDSVYLDLDDTLIIADAVNLNVIRFVYQCYNKQIPVYLLTKHCKEVQATLEKHAICKTLFKEIIHISENNKKSSYIKDSSPILIDNAFSERNEVIGSIGIPVFDVDAVEVLLDWKL